MRILSVSVINICLDIDDMGGLIIIAISLIIYDNNRCRFSSIFIHFSSMITSDWKVTRHRILVQSLLTLVHSLYVTLVRNIYPSCLVFMSEFCFLFGHSQVQSFSVPRLTMRGEKGISSTINGYFILDIDRLWSTCLRPAGPLLN